MAKIRRTFTLDGDVSDKIDEHAPVHRLSASGMANWLLAKQLGLVGDMETRPDTDPAMSGKRDNKEATKCPKI